jgi:uncharacterized membrane protein (UPF0127 family)
VAPTGLVARDLTRGTVVAARVEVAEGLWAKFMGLMGRRQLADGAALWLPDSNGIHMMFMRFPIDAVFLGGPGAAPGPGAKPGLSDTAAPVRRVLAIHRDLPAWRGLVPFVRGARGVLELPVGAVDAAGVQLGDEIELRAG